MMSSGRRISFLLYRNGAKEETLWIILANNILLIGDWQSE
jgi:hypothetical protein